MRYSLHKRPKEQKFEDTLRKYKQRSSQETKYPQKATTWTIENAMFHGPMYLSLKAMDHEIQP